VGLEDVSLLAQDALANLVQAPEQAIRAVVWKCRPRKAHEAGRARTGRDGSPHWSLFIAGSGRHHHVLMTKLAQKVTS
jgi:hypothetical protein